MNPRLTIAIAGAGMGGLTAAALLHDRGHRVTVFDQFDRPRPVGSGLVLQPVGQGVLDQIGAGDAARAAGAPIHRMFGHEADSKRPVLNVAYDPQGTGVVGLGIHRAALHQVLWQAVLDREITLRPSTRVTSASNRHLHFEGGTSEGPFDLIVDASGAGSPLSPLRSRALPYGAIWGTVDWPDTTLPRTELRQAYRRANRMIGVLPLGHIPGQSGQKAAIFWSLPATDHAAWMTRGLTAWHDEAATLWPDFAPFAAQITAPDQMTMATYTHGTLRKPFDDGIAYIGDAAHRASPQLGQGANMAMLDALALTRALDLANGQNPLRLYASARRAHVWSYQAFSWLFTPQYQSNSTVLPVIRDRFFYPLSQLPPVPRILTSLVRGSMVPPLASLNR